MNLKNRVTKIEKQLNPQTLTLRQVILMSGINGFSDQETIERWERKTGKSLNEDDMAIILVSL